MFVILVFIILGGMHINTENFKPFAPYGFKGIMSATGGNIFCIHRF